MGAIEIETLKQDVQDGRIAADRLVELLASQQRVMEELRRQLRAANERIEEFEKKWGSQPTAKLDEPFSLRGEEKRQNARGKKAKAKSKKRRGRLRTKDKVAQAERREPVYPEGVAPSACHFSHVRGVWRLEDGRAVLVAYEIYRGRNSRYGQIPGVLGRSEFGLEIVTEIAHLVYIVGMSLDKTCALLHFFQKLKLTKSQVDALLNQLARHWERQFDVLCTLLANSLVVHADETSWSLHSVWAFLSEQARVLLFGVHKDAETLRKIVDPLIFAGIIVSDDAAVYGNFNAAQKCWAHLLRKAIKLTLQDAQRADYRSFADGLLAIYRAACGLQRDQRYSDAGRAVKVGMLDDKVLLLCDEVPLRELSAAGLDHDFGLLVREVMRVMMNQELFTFVTAPPVQQPNGTTKPVSGTNNEAERTLRGAAQARVTGRTNKTGKGARRQTVLSSVLESLRLYLQTFTLDSVMDELKRWWAHDQSCFEKLLKKLKLKPQPSAMPILDQIFPRPTPSPTPSG